MERRYLFISLVLQVLGSVVAQIPSVMNYTKDSPSAFFRITPHTRVVVDGKRSNSGTPTLEDFARTFLNDLADVVGFRLPYAVLDRDAANSSQPSILLTIDTSINLTYNNGRSSSEGYQLNVNSNEVIICGSGAIGTWWGSRTFLQMISVKTLEGGQLSHLVSVGSGLDVPGWEVRGFMLDAGRHWFETSFLTDLCIYASFFKINEFHIHASDNLWNPAFLYSPGDAWKEVYAGFRFQPENGSPVSGIVPSSKRNETWTREEFTAVQTTCAEHGVTIIPEIDTPGHSLVITQWKPDLMIQGTPDNLNLSYPDTIPTIKSLWDEFLPWFSASEVSIGADEYDASLADDYINFVDDMSSYIHAQSGKRIRVWGTNEPSKIGLSVSTNITIQHWDFPGDDIPVALMDRGYDVINSEQTFLYLDGKTSDGGQFPQELNQTLMWTGAPGGGGWAPNVFSATNAGNNTTPGNPRLRGAIMALWNDWGNNATTQLEIYYQLARSLAVFGEKTWAGSGIRSTELTQDEFDSIYPILNSVAPGQNLNRVVVPKHGNVVYSYNLYQPHESLSELPLNTSVASVGPPYNLTFRVKPTSQDGILFSGIDSLLRVGNLTFEALGQRYSLRYTLPLHKWTTVTIRATREYTYAVIDGNEDGKLWWTTLMDIWGEYLAVGNMSFAAPAQIIGPSFQGTIDLVDLTLG